jgi:UDP-GlcNAc3NAcA epimerase
MRKIITIVGARPQFIKAAALSRAIRSHSAINEILIHTGQHFDANMSDVFFGEMEIPLPNYQLQIAGLNHGAMTGRMMEEIEGIVLKEKPDAVLVYGDTNSTLAGSLVASKLHIPVIHVEAGLRSFNMEMPEEINRILTDRISALLLCPTEQAIINLKNEGFDKMPIAIELVGDIMEDAALYYKEKSKLKSGVIKRHNLKLDKFILFTLHRAENTNNPARMIEIIKGVNEVASQCKVLWPVHPRMKDQLGTMELNENILIIEPVGYFDMIELIDHSKLVMTDSGGLQKEAYFFNKFCVTIRDQTEWVELVHHGFNALVGADSKRIYQAFQNFDGKKFDKFVQLYGNGTASSAMVKAIEILLNSKD